MNQERNEMFETAPIYKVFFYLTLPAVIGKLVMLFYNVADTWFIAATGNPDLVAGVSLVSPVFVLMIALGDIFGVGGSSVIARLFGQYENETARRVSSFCFYGAFACSTLIAVVFYIFRIPVLQMLGADEHTMPYALDYYRWIIIGMPFISTSIVPLNLLITEGKSKASMAGSITGSVLNLILDPLFIFVFDMGAAGAAIATVLGNVGAVILYTFCYRKTSWLSVSIRYCKVSLGEMKQVLVIGLPASLVNIMNSYSTALTNRFLLPFGNDKIAAWGIASKIAMIANMILIGFAYAAQPLIGYNYGQKNYPRLKDILKFVYSFLISLGLILSLILGIWAPQFFGFFMSDPAIVQTGSTILRWQLAGVVLTAFILVSTCTFQATGKAGSAFILCIGRRGVIFTVVLLLLNLTFGYAGVIAVMPATDLLAVILTAFLLKNSVLRELRNKN